MDRYIVAIDPGNEQSAYVILGPDLRPIASAKLANELMYAHMTEAIYQTALKHPGAKFNYAIEMIASYGMPVGAEVFDTCRWIGRLEERLRRHGVTLIYRKDEKITLCGSMKANDATIKQALIDRFAPGAKNYGKGTKKEPGWFYGFKADIWAAYAVGVTYHDMYIGTGKHGG